MKKSLNYFLKGLLFIVPIFISLYVIYWAITSIDNIFAFSIPGLGLLIVLGGTTLIGYFVNSFITKPFFDYFEEQISRIPLFKLIYTSIKDLMEAFVGDEKKFKESVIIDFNSSGLKRIGFITEKDLSLLDMEGYVAVYCPHSYNFSGNLFLVETKNIKPIKLNSSTMMKFVVSGGVTDLNEVEEPKSKK